MVELYRLDTISGKTVMCIAETERMIRDVKSGRIKALIFSKIARFARNTRELLAFSDMFKEYGADLVSLEQNIDTSTRAGELMFTILGALGQWKLGEIGERVAASVPIRAKLGKSLAGLASFGYKWQDGKYEIDEKEAPIRKLMYELFLQIHRKKTTANELNKRGYRTRNGALFSNKTIDRLLRDTNAKGLRLVNYTKSRGKKKSPMIKPQEEWIIVPCPAIVNIELWNECNHILDEQQAKNKQPGPKAVYLLAGFVKCHCGTTMYVRSTKNYSCRQCKNRISVEDIDEIYIKYLQGYLCDINSALYTDEATQSLNEKEQLLVVTNKKRAKLRKQMDELVPLRLNGELSKV